MRAVMLPRQAGKTHILVLEAEKALRKGQSVLVVVPTLREGEHVRRLIFDRFREKCCCCGQLKPPPPLPLTVTLVDSADCWEKRDVVLIDNLDIVLGRLLGQDVELATVNDDSWELP